VPVAVRRGQRCDAAATEEERHGRCAARKSKYIRLHRNSGKLALAPMQIRRARVVGSIFAAGAQPMTHVCTAGAAKKNSAWASGAPTGGRRAAVCLGQRRALPQRAARREVRKHKKPFGLQIVQQNFKLPWHRLFQERGSSPRRQRSPKICVQPTSGFAGFPLQCSVF
jgi:hypothetical protein